jgi:hypothetical protein
LIREKHNVRTALNIGRIFPEASERRCKLTEDRILRLDFRLSKLFCNIKENVNNEYKIIVEEYKIRHPAK